MQRAALASAIALLCLVPAHGQGTVQTRAWMDRTLAPGRRAELLVAAMTLDEKIEQIHMMDVPEHPREVPGIARLGVPVFKITNGPAGAGPGDAPKGTPQRATALPAAIALAASWDPDAARTFGHVAAREVADRGEHLLEAPGMNIARVPRNGRNFEYYGEDPWLASRLAAAEIQGIQGEGVIAEAKHYAANNQETNRKTIDETIDERTLREIYLPAFEASVTEGEAGAIMCAYPSVNGQFGCENVHLLRDILRGEWRFRGFVQSDYTATHSAVRSARAGLDLAMKPEHYSGDVREAIASGELRERDVDRMLVRRYAQMFRFGQFDVPRDPKPIPAEADGADARALAEQSAVLLKNDNHLLPIDTARVHTIAVIGPYAAAAHTGGGGSSAVAPLYTVAPVDGLKRAAGPGVRVTYDAGDALESASRVAAASDVAVVMVGNKDREGTDRPSLSLPNGQDRLVAAVAAANPRTIVVLKTGGAVLMPWLPQVPAVLEAWYPGEEDGNVVADLLFGVATPSGKLPVTFPRADADTAANTPEQYPGVNGKAVYSERLLVGYRWNDANRVDPLFPFGFGLSYTTFTLANLQTPAATGGGTAVTVSVEVANTGNRTGAEVVQVYVEAPAGAGEPPRQLKGFAKVRLNAGEHRRVEIPLDPHAFSIWDVARGGWVSVAGTHRLRVGTSSRALPLAAAITVTSNQ